ncbi:hypothetical protein [Streptomyces sp. LN500]|uniref:hypothetical protein n=1 Tax=Streptomyces sp. LN500 TaxID=3112978 RepID=UPI003710D15D
MRTRLATAAIGAAALLVLTACGSSDNAPDAKPATTGKAKAKASDTPPSAPPAPLALGTISSWKNSYEGKAANDTAVALAYTQPARGLDLPIDSVAGEFDNPEWAILEVKACNTKGINITVSQGPWALRFPDDTRIEAPFISGGGVPKPEYPTSDKLLRPGDCIRGKLLFAVEKGKRPDRIVYSAGTLEPVEWAVPAK